MEKCQDKSNKQKKRELENQQSSQSYTPKAFKPKNQKTREIKNGKWSLEEQRIYLNFMREKRSDFLDERSRRCSRIFLQLSKSLKQRTLNQCRSHHQKFQIKCQFNIDQIIQTVEQKIQLIQQSRKKPKSQQKAQNIIQLVVNLIQANPEQIKKKQQETNEDTNKIYTFEPDRLQISLNLLDLTEY